MNDQEYQTLVAKNGKNSNACTAKEYLSMVKHLLFKFDAMLKTRALSTLSKGTSTSSSSVEDDLSSLDDGGAMVAVVDDDSKNDRLLIIINALKWCLKIQHKHLTKPQLLSLFDADKSLNEPLFSILEDASDTSEYSSFPELKQRLKERLSRSFLPDEITQAIKDFEGDKSFFGLFEFLLLFFDTPETNVSLLRSSFCQMGSSILTMESRRMHCINFLSSLEGYSVSLECAFLYQLSTMIRVEYCLPYLEEIKRLPQVKASDIFMRAAGYQYGLLKSSNKHPLISAAECYKRLPSVTRTGAVYITKLYECVLKVAEDEKEPLNVKLDLLAAVLAIESVSPSVDTNSNISTPRGGRKRSLSIFRTSAFSSKSTGDIQKVSAVASESKLPRSCSEPNSLQVLDSPRAKEISRLREAYKKLSVERSGNQQRNKSNR